MLKQPVVIELPLGTTVQVAEFMIKKAQEIDGPVRGSFNDIPMEAYPDSTVREVHNCWNYERLLLLISRADNPREEALRYFDDEFLED